MFGVIVLPLILHDSDTGANLLDQLFDVNGTNPSQDDIIVFDNSSQTWITTNITQFLQNQSIQHINVGGGAEVLKDDIVGINATFRTLIGGGAINIIQNNDTLTIQTGGQGQNNSIANIQTPNGLFQAGAQSDTVEFFGNGIAISNTSSVFFELNATLDQINDVEYTDLDGGDILVFNSTSGNWTDFNPAAFTGITDTNFNAEEASIDDLTGVDCINDVTYSLFDNTDINEYRRQAIEFCEDSDSDDNITWLYTVPRSYDIVAPVDFKFKLFWTEEGAGSATVIRRVDASANDAEESSPAASNPFDMSLTSSDLELHNETLAEAGANDNDLVGMRWTNITIPQAATITNAQIQFHVDEVNPDLELEVIFDGHDVDNSPIFTSTDGDISDRVGTTATVNWNIPHWENVSDEGAAQLTPNLASIVQEIVDRGSWVSGNALTIMIRDWVDTGDDTAERHAESYDGESGSAPEITISYTTGTADLPVCFELALLPLAASEIIDGTFSGRQTVCTDRSGMDNLSITEFTVTSAQHNFVAEDLVILRLHRPNDFVANDFEGAVTVFGGALEWID
jgi:hypothetical protein